MTRLADALPLVGISLSLAVLLLGGGKASEEPRIDYCVLWWVGCEVANKARAYFFASRSHVWSLSINASTRARHSLDHDRPSTEDRHKLTWNASVRASSPPSITKHASHVRLTSSHRHPIRPRAPARQSLRCPPTALHPRPRRRHRSHPRWLGRRRRRRDRRDRPCAWPRPRCAV